MKLHHAAALALVGWYLIVPPVPFSTETPPPLYKWTPAKVFDSAAQCERQLAKQVTVQRLDEKSVKSGSAGLGETNWSARWFDVPAKYQRCIASDDPRLKEK